MKKQLTTIAGLVLVALFTLNACTSQQENQKTSGNDIKMVLDLDTGIDDALALAYAIADPNVELLGVTGTFGNVVLEQGIKNTLELLQVLGKPEIPVFAGASHSLSDTEDYQTDSLIRYIHGNNGIGDVVLPAAEAKVQEEDAVDFLIRMADTYGKELTVVAVGPLTNVAKAMEKDPSFVDKVGEIVVMGGAVTVPGNTTKFAEANIYNDPVAANQVLKSKAHVTLVGLDVTYRTVITEKETAEWRSLGVPAATALADIADYCINICKDLEPELGGCPLNDPLAAVVAVDPSLVTTFDLNINVGTGADDYGRTSGDKARLLDEHPNVSVCIDVDHERFNHHFSDVLYRFFQTMK